MFVKLYKRKLYVGLTNQTSIFSNYFVFACEGTCFSKVLAEIAFHTSIPLDSPMDTMSSKQIFNATSMAELRFCTAFKSVKNSAKNTLR